VKTYQTNKQVQDLPLYLLVGLQSSISQNFCDNGGSTHNWVQGISLKE